MNPRDGMTAALIGFILSSGAAFAEDTWPGFRGRGDSLSRAKSLPVTWESRGRSGGWTVNRVGAAQCIDVKTGDEKWQHRLPGSVWASPVGNGGNVYFFGKDGQVVVLEAGPELKEVGESSLSATDVIYGVAAAEGAWVIRSGRSLIKVAAESGNGK